MDAGLREALASLPIITFTATADGRIDWVSERWYRATGIPRDAVLGEAWVQVVHPDDVEHIVWLWTQALDRGTPWEAMPRVRHADGSYRLWYTRAELYGPEGADPIWVGTMIELSGLPLKTVGAHPEE